jgi:arylsulfatase A
MRTWINMLAASIALCASFILSGLQVDAAEGPNVIFILADDMGYGDVGALNPESKIKTPNLDALARGGMVFTDAHSSSSVCTPTRYGVLTGRYNWRTKLQNGVCWGFSRRLIEPGRETVASMLKGAGYHTAAIGKWHLGMDWPRLESKGGGFADDGMRWDPKYRGGWDVDFSKPIENGPNTVGFDYFFGISASLDMPPYVYIENDHAHVSKLVEKTFYNRTGPADSEFEDIDVLPRITEKAVAYIHERAEADEDRPFFLYFPLNAPHTPIVPIEKWQGKSGLNKYGDFVMQVDDSIGQVMQALEANGISENTLIIFTADNGCSPAARIDEMKKKGHFPNWIFRGHKADIFEGGHRVPFIARWPAVVEAGSESNRLTCLNDLMATCNELIGQELPDNAGEDSVSFLPALKGNDDISTHEAIVHHSINGTFSIRRSDWKLELCAGSGGWSSPRPNRDETSKLTAVQLYNLKNDISETTNVVADHLNVATDLLGLLQSYVKNGRSTSGESQENAVDVDVFRVNARAGKFFSSK